MIITKKTLQIKENVNTKIKASSLKKKPFVHTTLKKISPNPNNIKKKEKNQKEYTQEKPHKNEEKIITGNKEEAIQMETRKYEFKMDEDEKTIQTTPLLEPVKGNVIIKYNHYNSYFSISNGQLLKSIIVEKYAISFAFLGDFKLHLKGKEKKFLEETKERFLNLIDKETYFLEIEEDAIAEAKREKKIYNAEDSLSICLKKEEKNVELLTKELKNMDIQKQNRDEDYKKFIEARDLEDILYK